MNSDMPKNKGKPTSSSRSWPKTIFCFFGGFIVFILLLLALVPTLASTSWGKKQFENALNAKIPGKLHIGDLAVSWFGPQNFHDVTLKSPEGKTILTVSQISTSSSIFNLLQNAQTANAVNVENLNATMVVEASGTTNFERALSKQCCQTSVTDAKPVTIELRDTNVQIDLRGGNEGLKANLTGNTLRNALKGQFSIDAQLTGVDSANLLKNGDLLKKLLDLSPGDTFKLKADIAHFPVALVDQLLAFEHPEAAGMITQLLGDELNATIHQTATDQGMTFTLNAAAARFSADFQVDANEKLSLKKPATFSLQITPELAEKLVKISKSPILWKLNAPTVATVTIDRLSYPLNAIREKHFADYNLQDLDLTTHFQLKNASLSGDKSVGTIEVHDLQASCEITPGSNMARVALLGDALHDQQPLNINVDATFEKPMYLRDLANKLQQQMTAKILVEGDISRTLDTLFATDNLVLKSVGNTTSLSALVNIVDNTPAVTISLDSSFIKFSDLILNYQENVLKGNEAKISFDLPARTPSQSPLTGHLSVRNFSLNTAELPDKIQADVNIDGWVLNDGVNEINHAVDATLVADFALGEDDSPFSRGFFEVNVNHDMLSGRAIFSVGKAITLKPGSANGHFTLQMTPEHFLVLRKLFNVGNGDAGLSLQEPTKVALQLNRLHIPLAENVPVFEKSAIEGILTIPRLSLASSSARQSVILSDIQIDVQSSNIADQIAFNTQARGGRGYFDEDGKQANISVNGLIAQVLTADGKFDPNMSLTLNGSADGIPLPLLCELICSDPLMNKKLQAVFGNRVNVQAKTQLKQMNGPIFLAVKGSNGNFTLDGTLSNGHLRLNRNFEAEVNVTPELGKYVLQDLAPVLAGIQSSDKPLKLIVDQQGFDLSIRNPSLNQLTIAKASLDLGKLYFANNGPIGKALKLLTPSTAQSVSIWLTPAYFSLSRGALALQRVDMLVSDHYPLAAWGNVDFANDRVNVMLGLSGAAISKAFGVSSIKNKYMLQMPLRGTLKDASIDKSRIATRLSAIVAQSHGSPQGFVLGTVLDIASGGLTEEAPPQPTTNPLPWASQLEDNESQANDTTDANPDDSKAQKMKNPIKQIGKEASNLLKDLFR